ncbi:MAG: dihydroneopterin aldolase [Gammaproteobacteria bacterium]|nr:dihydroneopterin aldolase [Gammaproteobacteria bacterium]
MDIIYLNAIRIEAIIGIYEWERRARQTVILDIEMGTDVRVAAASDNLNDTLDYKAVAQRIIAYASGSEFHLVETLAERIAEILLSEFKSPWCRIRLNKQGVVKGVRDVGVIIERGRR